MLVQSVDRALAILDLLQYSQRGLGVSQIAQPLGLHVSTAHHLLRTLALRDYVRQDPETRRYMLSHHIVRLASRFVEELGLISISFPHLRELSVTTGESVRLSVLGDTEVLTLLALEATEPVPPAPRDGKWRAAVPAHCSASGKVLLAALKREELRAFVDRTHLPSYTAHTITDLEALEKELSTVRIQGYALDRQELQEWVVCVGAPIIDVAGSVAASVTVACAVYHCTAEKLRWLTDQTIATARRISTAVISMNPPLHLRGHIMHT